MCRTDVHFAKNDWGETIYPLEVRYEITGIIEKVGSKVNNFKIGVVGLGGLGHLAIKFGKTYGHHVTVLSTFPSKEKDAKELLGAHDFVVATNEDEIKRAIAGSLNEVLRFFRSGSLIWVAGSVAFENRGDRLVYKRYLLELEEGL
ncbi:hypothetical protein MTR67_034159 [Solanum verrucosum]|uniref:Alcohol dehydrogenase n=1 Tax=Solanum verrucosum TaxID=315347 RepID=A0AAF0ZL23_SOLVR|nr:hypothetical protein MTR67_034159 [Solanum verrucosum]